MSAKEFTILDGGMGRELEQRGAPFRQPEWSALALMDAPEVVKEIHQTFIQSGARVITTNSYALVPFHIGEEWFNRQGRFLAAMAGKMARAAADEMGIPVRIAGSIPPLFGSYRPDLYQPDQVERIATPLIEALAPYTDLWLCETQSTIDEPLRIKALIDSVDSGPRPFWVAFTLEDATPTAVPLLRSGERVLDAIRAMVDAGGDAILFNCCQPEVIGAAIETTRQALSTLGADHIPIGAYANAFGPQSGDARANEEISELRKDVTPSAYLDWARLWIQEGATLIGGCCGIGPGHIMALSEYKEGKPG